ncbi:DUF3000 domain-containing protein [Wenjunlia tyrosinilytica]|uniref:DUF3000 domain-containing protein n=1 Tax=Wenjunlia tyrosinilytica TaxID=1544741 RepID=A0A918E054_9ACTN|nr:DUF3000 domain-containing protein [Wenjunlia tyrosinilytica]GGO92164.1 hypothetical protein GCM10012280_41710 [Wenjunlia tyrosinilytica]
MAAVSGHLADGDGTPPQFQRAVEALRAAAVRPEVELTPTRAPQRLAPYAYAVTGSVTVEGEELADGRFVLLHDPDGHEAWQGDFRVVTLARADLEPEMAQDPLLAEVGWSWLTGALEGRGARFGEPSGTVSRCSSHFFGGLSERPVSTTVEIRASWTPEDRGAGPDLPAHLAAWADLLCTTGGLPPSGHGDDGGPGSGRSGGGGVVPMPSRRSPQRH